MRMNVDQKGLTEKGVAETLNVVEPASFWCVMRDVLYTEFPSVKQEGESMEVDANAEVMTGHDLDWIRSARLLKKKQAGTLTEEEAKQHEELDKPAEFITVDEFDEL